MTYQYLTNLIEFSTPDGLVLPGLLFTPPKPTNKVAIFLHGCGSSSVFYSVKRAHGLARALTAKGIALLLFNNRGAHYIKTINKLPDRKENTDELHYNDITLGTAYELIKDCVFDINGAVAFLKQRNYQQLSLIGHSTGANKICVYDHYQPDNSVEKYVLLGGGDDTGMYYKAIGNHQKFQKYLKQAQEKISQSKGKQLVPKYILDGIMSYQSFFNTINPDGDYNCFPFAEYQKQFNLSNKPLFRYFKAINKPSLIIYGEHDEYSPDKSGQKALEILSYQVQGRSNFQFQLTPGADHRFHGKELQLGEKIASWL